MKILNYKKAYIAISSIIVACGILLSPIFPAVAYANDPLQLDIGQSHKLITTLGTADWKSYDSDIVSVDENGMVKGNGVGLTKVLAVSNGQAQHRTVFVRAPENSPSFSSREQLRTALAKSASSGVQSMTFKLSVDNLPEDENKAKENIKSYFPTSDEFFVAYCRELRFNFIWLGSGNNTTVEATCTYQYDTPAEVAAAYRGENIALTNKAKVLKEKCDEILRELKISDMKTKYEITLAIHDYIVKNAYYNKLAVNNSDLYPDSYSAYGVLVQGTGVCQSYAEAMKLLLNASGIECDYVVGVANENHVWNRVQLDDGKWYNIDATWNDPLPDRGDSVSHTYFGITDSELERTHTWTDYSNKCTSTTYSYKNIVKLLENKGS